MKIIITPYFGCNERTFARKSNQMFDKQESESGTKTRLHPLNLNFATGFCVYQCNRTLNRTF